MQYRSVEFKGNTISYYIAGNGPLVMLIHGFAEDSRIWDGQVEQLQTNFQVIVPDLPGCGRSEFIGKGDEADHLSIGELAELADNILIDEKVEKCTMIGHSMGGYISLAYAE